MKYIHPKLWREAITQDARCWLYKIENKNWSYPWNFYVTDTELKALWFEPIEEVPERVVGAFEYYEKYRVWTDRHRKTDRSVFYEALTKYMPKQEKITRKKVDGWLESYSGESGYRLWYIKGTVYWLLRDKWLLQE